MKRLISVAKELPNTVAILLTLAVTIPILILGCDTQAHVDQEALNKAKDEGRAEVKSIADSAYKQGQIDALTGKIKFRLVEHDDHTLSWDAAKDDPSTQPTVRKRTAHNMPYLAPMNDGHGGYIYVPMQEITEKVEK
jgi:hypothetical protein